MRWITVLCVFAGCYEAPVGDVVTTVSEVTDYSFLASARDQVDLLFLIDDSRSMAPKQEELKRRFPELIRKLEELGAAGKKASYHIGVVTSDLTAGTVCPAAGRKNGALIDIGDAARGSGGCLPLADGAKFIRYDQRDGANNLPGGQDLATTFGCMASVGTSGCGFEQSLEAVYRALHDPPAGNAGFLRDDAILAVVFVTDEDDCSAPAGSPIFDNRSDPRLGPVDSFRCFQFGVRCGDPPMSIPAGPGAWSRCEPAAPADGGELTDVQKYINFFSLRKANGGLKRNPQADVLLMAIAGAPSYPIKTVLAQANTVPHVPCSSYDGKSCVWQLDHGCRSQRDPSWVGDPAVRLGRVIAAVPSKSQAPRFSSICDDSFTPALAALAESIEKGIDIGCVDRPFTNPADPQCTVKDVGDDGQDHVISDCGRSSGRTPCWRLVDNPRCPSIVNPIDGSTQQAGIAIDRGGQPVPQGTSVEIECATIASRS